MKNFTSIGLSYLSQKDLLRWLQQYTETPATIYDDAMDAVYNSTHIGGSDHRLFDGGHDPLGAWDAVANASDTDTLTQEVIGYVSAMFKDMSTVSGMPFVTIDKNWYETSSEWVTTNMGVSKDWYKDLLTCDTLEVFSSTLGIVSSLYFLKKGDMEAVSRILGSMSIIALISANPLMGISVIFMCVYAFMIKKYKLENTKFLKGMGVSTIATIVFSAVSLNVIVELVIFLCLMKFLNKRVLTSIELRDKLFHLACQTKELVQLMITNVSSYEKLNTSYKVALLNASNTITSTEKKLSGREKLVKKLKEMK